MRFTLLTPCTGLDQSGLPEAIAHSIALLPSELQGMFWANVALVGGNAKTPGFAQRLTRELRTWAPADGPVHVYEATEFVSHHPIPFIPCMLTQFECL